MTVEVPSPTDDLVGLGSLLARLWAARDVEQAAAVAADGALSFPGVAGARLIAPRGDCLAAAGGWDPPRPRRAGRRGRDGTVAEDRTVLGADGSVIGTLSVQTAPGADVLPAVTEALLDTLAAQLGHVLDTLGRADRLVRYQTQFLTERARAMHGEARWQAAFDESPIGMLMVSLASGRVGDVLEVNDALCRMTRRSAAQLRSGRVADLIVAQDAGPLTSVLARAVTGRRTSSTLVLRLRAGSAGGSVTVRVTTAPVFDDDGVPLSALCHVEDLTERENARDAPGAHRDPGSGLLTRASFTDALDRIHHRALRAGVSTGVLLCDLSLGPPGAPDLDPRVLAEVRAELARQVQTVLRPDDAVGQLDETTIGVALAELSTADAQAIAGRIHAAMTTALASHDLAGASTPDEPIAIAMIDPGVVLGTGVGDVLDRTYGRLRGPSRPGPGSLLSPRPEPLGTKIILWQRPAPGTEPPRQSSRVTLWQRARPS